MFSNISPSVYRKMGFPTKAIAIAFFDEDPEMAAFCFEQEQQLILKLRERASRMTSKDMIDIVKRLEDNKRKVKEIRQEVKTATFEEKQRYEKELMEKRYIENEAKLQEERTEEYTLPELPPQLPSYQVVDLTEEPSTLDHGTPKTQICEEVKTEELLTIDHGTPKMQICDEVRTEDPLTLVHKTPEMQIFDEVRTELPLTIDHRTPAMKIMAEVRHLRGKFKECFNYYVTRNQGVMDNMHLHRLYLKNSECFQVLKNCARALMDYD